MRNGPPLGSASPVPTSGALSKELAMVSLGPRQLPSSMNEAHAQYIVGNPRNVHHVKKVIFPLCLFILDPLKRLTV